MGGKTPDGDCRRLPPAQTLLCQGEQAGGQLPEKSLLRRKRDDLVRKPEDPDEIDADEKDGGQNHNPAVFFEINKSFKNESRRDQRSHPEQGMAGKGAGQIQVQNADPGPGDAAAGTGNPQEKADGTSGKTGDQIIENTDEKQGCLFLSSAVSFI